MSQDLRTAAATLSDLALHGKHPALAEAALAVRAALASTGADTVSTDTTLSALDTPGCERLREWAQIGPVQRAAVETFAAALAQPQQAAPAGQAANALRPMTPDQIERHIGPDEGDREAVTAIVREVEAWHDIGRQAPAGQAAAPEPMTSERHFALREGHCIGASDAYFKAWPTHDNDAGRMLFERGFVRGFDSAGRLYDGQHEAPAAQAGQAAAPAKPACKYGDPFCPCQDGDLCHYEGTNPMQAPAAEAVPAQAVRLTTEAIDAAWDAWFGAAGFQTQPGPATRHAFARAVERAVWAANGLRGE